VEVAQRNMPTVEESSPAEHDDLSQPAQRMRPHIPRGPGDWAVDGPLPVRIRSWRPGLPWFLGGIFLVMFLGMAWASLVNGTPLAVIIFLALAVLMVACSYRLTLMGFNITTHSVKVTNFWRSRTIARADVVRFGSRRIPPKINQQAHFRLELVTRGSTKPVMLPTGEDLLIPAEDVAASLNALYGFGTSDAVSATVEDGRVPGVTIDGSQDLHAGSESTSPPGNGRRSIPPRRSAVSEWFGLVFVVLFWGVIIFLFVHFFGWDWSGGG